MGGGGRTPAGRAAQQALIGKEQSRLEESESREGATATNGGSRREEGDRRRPRDELRAKDKSGVENLPPAVLRPLIRSN